MLDYEYLIHLIDCAVHDTVPQEKPPEVSFERVLQLGKMHEVANIAFLSVERLEHKPEPAVFDEWQIAYYFAVQRDLRQQSVYQIITDALHQNGVRTLEAQGTITKTLYPSPEWRMMSDIDLIIDEDNIGKVREAMESLGYPLHHQHEGDLEITCYGDLPVEFHTAFFTNVIYKREERFSAAIHSPFAHATPDADNPLQYHLDPTFFYLYAVLHTVKHFETMGCGIRRVLDLYYLKKAFAATADMAYCNQVFDTYGFRESVDALFALEGEWFEHQPSGRDLTQVIVNVITAGSQGTVAQLLHNNIQKEKNGGQHFPKTRRVFRKVFPPKAYICANYPECEARGYSALTCQFYRIFRKLKAFRLQHALRYIRTILRS